MNPVVVRNVAIGEGIPKICVPIVGKTREEILDAAKKILPYRRLFRKACHIFVVFLIRHMHENSPFGLVCAIGGIFTQDVKNPP